MKKLYTLILFSTLLQYSFGQNTCCNALSGTTFAAYCIEDVVGCAATVPPCDPATFDAVFGQQGFPLNWFGHQCSDVSICTPGNCGGGLLPVEMKSFNLKIVNHGIELHWVTATETDNMGFEIEKSTNGKDWFVLGYVEGQINSQKEHSYAYTDKYPVLGPNYYRLKQIDLDGSYQYTPLEVAMWRGGTENFQMAVMPNPATDWMVVAMPPATFELSEFQFEIYDFMGRFVRQVTTNSNSNPRLDISDLSAGAYIIHLKAENLSYRAKFLKKE